MHRSSKGSVAKQLLLFHLKFVPDMISEFDLKVWQWACPQTPLAWSMTCHHQLHSNFCTCICSPHFDYNHKCLCLTLQLGNLERKWQHHEQNNFAMKECILIALLHDKPVSTYIYTYARQVDIFSNAGKTGDDNISHTSKYMLRNCFVYNLNLFFTMPLNW